MRIRRFFAAIAIPLFLLLAPQLLFSQGKVITGKVTDAKDGSGLSGVTVEGKGAIGTQTGPEGVFRITVGANTSTLTFSYVGYASQDVSITGKSEVNVSLEVSNDAIGEVVVIGYATARRRDVTGAVTSVKAKDFQQGVIAAPDQLLQNKVAGLDISVNSGQPGAATTVKIRGNSSIRSSNNPLYVVDGVPLDGRTARPSVNLGNNGLGFGTTPESNPLLFINPNDIAQVDVLKDASSAAIYGSRGANGVIAITTKKGAAGATKVDVGTSFGVADYMKKYKVLDAGQFRSAITKYAQPATYDGGASVDAQDAIAQHKLAQNYNLSMAGGTGTGKFRASFLGSKQPGLLKKSSLDKYLASFSGQYKLLDEKLSLDFGLIAGHYTEHLTLVSNTAGSQGNLISAALNWNPTVAFRNAQGLYNLNSNAVVNPLALSDAFDDVSGVNAVLANISASYKILPNLEYKFLYAINNMTGNRSVNIEGFLEGLTNLSGQGFALLANAKLTSQTIDHTLNWRVNLSKDLSMDALAGFEYWKTNFSNNNIAASGFNTNLNQSNRIGIPYTNIFQNARQQFPQFNIQDPTVELQSYFGRLNFNYLDKYLLTGTFRADGSSKFGANNKYGYFPSLGAKWVLSNEEFLKGKTFSNLAIRASWGITGNQEYPAGASQEQFGLSSFNTAGQTIVANPDLKWETTNSINIGLDLSFGNGKYSASIDYYTKDTKNILFQTNAIQPAPSSIYFINIPANLMNNGVEVTLGASLIEKKNFSWDANLNFNYNKNMLKNFFDINTGLPLQILTGQINGQGVSGTLGQVITNNQPVNEFFLKPFTGYETNGSPKIGGSGSETFAGNPNPTVVGGFSTSLRYKKLTLTLNAGGAFGYMIYNNTATSVTNINNITSGRNIDLYAYQSPEDKGSGAVASTRFLEKGDYVKLRNATFLYNVGPIGKFIKSSSVFIGGTNLFVLTKFKGFDPEVNVDKSSNNYPSRSIEYIPYPTPRTISGGINISL